MGVCLPHEHFQMMVKTHQGVEAMRLPAAAFVAPDGLGPLLQNWCSKPDIALDIRDVAMLGLHADGVSYTSTLRFGASKGVLVASRPSHRGQRYLFFALTKSHCCDCGCESFHTWNPLLNIFAWSMRVLQLGRAPTCRHGGSPFF